MQYKKFNARSLITLIIATAAISLTACSETPSAPEDKPLRPVKLITVGSDDSGDIRSFPAVVEATQTADLTFRVGGELTELPWRPGHEVEQGDLIAALDPTDYRLTAEQARARAELAQAQYDRIEQLAEQNIISRSQFDEAKAELQVAQANLNTAETNLGYTKLHAPFAGVIANLHVELYENIGPQQPIITLQVDDMIDVRIQVPEQLFAQVRRDLSYQPDITFESLPGQTFKGQIREWDRIADSATNTYRVVFTLPKPEIGNILPGMSASVIIDSSQVMPETNNGITIPIGAVFTPTDEMLAENIRRVWIYQPAEQGSQGTLTARQVTIGAASSSGISILDGLNIGEHVVVAGVHRLEEGQAVRPWIRERGL
ncbi:efflux RND transporter periplasmic adaptor subunit [Aliidiomarina shirensis]|uniref:Efflux RND transporter periplasmic adaptor subunit n=1 Tax=Aliidiomarina shirensis TaxID=1048642 RepID=A0A432WUQ1_9GAMM|nr:efflux RND transporter periplasmic adaptor subunit [Aliidiomarina shirensis]RUO37493.1 efflux RND transporter periplasmic adaptor subunit [Aliidiomarina shirensis]